ncbi:MAG: hypothetical protein FWD99_06325 [Oscillospiraceae bacterium]|nr:hypothetical protein [Oscillospiraceae bacterium]
MELIFSLNANFVLSMFILLFYYKIINDKAAKLIYLFGASLGFVVYMFLTHASIIEPLRTIVGVFMLGVLMWTWKRSIIWAALTLAFLLGYITRLVALIPSAAIVALLQLEVSVVYWLIHLFVEVAIYVIVYRVIKLKNGVPSIADNEIKGIIFAITGILLTFYGGLHIVVNRMYEVNEPLFYTAMIALILVVLALIFLAVHLSKRHRERLQHFELQVKLDEVEKELDALASRHHKYKAVVPAVSTSYYKLIEEVKDILGKDKEYQLKSIQRFLDSTKKLAVEVGEEFAVDNLEYTLDELELPEEWYPLEARIRQVMYQCKEKDIGIFIRNLADEAAWAQISGLQVEFIRLVGNLLSNAAKELEKTEGDGKQIIISFLDQGGVFVFEVRDTAHGFPVEILTRLGERKNSTNKTGDGYAEIFEFLAESRATLEIMENQTHSTNYKIIRVVFDEEARLVIRTGYRYALLKDALAGTPMEVEAWDVT